jgi:thiosulfate dehydrogenase [quinone] large subunit
MSDDIAPTSACQGCAASGARADAHDPRRREFVTSMLLATVGSYFAAACGDSVIGGPLGPGNATLPNALVITVSDFPALATVGGTARVDFLTPRPVAVTRTGPTSFVALSMICPHQRYKPISITSFGFQCPNHGAEFDELGNWTGGQRTRSLVEYATVYDVGSDTLTIS